MDRRVAGVPAGLYKSKNAWRGCKSRRGVQLLPDPASLLVFAISVDLGGGGRILSWLAC